MLEINIRFKNYKLIDVYLLKQIITERTHWKNVLERLIKITIFFDQNYLVF